MICSGDWGVAVEGFEGDLFSISSSLTAQSGIAFILEIASVLEAYGEAVPTNLTLAFSTLPSYTIVLEDISLCWPIQGLFLSTADSKHARHVDLSHVFNLRVLYS